MPFARKQWFYKTTTTKKTTWSIKYTLFIAEVSCYFHISFWNLLSATGLDICLYICFLSFLLKTWQLLWNTQIAGKLLITCQRQSWCSELTQTLSPPQPLGGGNFTWNERSQRLGVGVHGESCRKVWDKVIYNICT